VWRFDRGATGVARAEVSDFPPCVGD